MTKPVLAAFLSCQSTTLTDEEKYIFAQANPVGFTLFSRNIENRYQLKTLIKDLKETVGRDNLLIAVDQEGGRVRRLKEPDFSSYSAQFDIGRLKKEDAVEATKLHADMISTDFHSVGLNVNFAPVLDILHQQTTEALRSRCFSSDASTVSLLGKTMVQQYMNNGIIPCIKHLPGHGLAISDPHLDLPVINTSLDKIQQETEPFKECRFAPFGMTAHILLPIIDNDNPLTQSPSGIKTLIREFIGFEGFLISDAIDMKALQGSVSEKASKALSAGCDCVCYCMARPNELKELSENCPQLSDISLERLDKALQTLHNIPQKVNAQQVSSRYSALTGQICPYQETYDATEVLHNLNKGTKNV